MSCPCKLVRDDNVSLPAASEEENLEVKSLQNVHEDVLVHSADENRLLEEL